jgi:FeS assembly SUF system protein
MNEQTSNPTASDQQIQALKARIIEQLRTVHDPEIPINIYDLGLIYEVNVDSEAKVGVRMTLTAPACPVAGQLPLDVAAAVRAIDVVNDVQVELVWDPPWSKSMMSDEARLALNMFD